MTDERLLQEIGASVNLASLSEKVGEPMDLRIRLYSLAIAYADARESKEIAELKADNARWCKDFYKIKFEIETAEAEIKRLRDGIKKGFEKLSEIPYCSVLRTIFDNAKGVQDDLESLLSPAPVTEGNDEDYDPEFCPQCNSMEWYNGDGECEYGCHHCGHVWIHGTPLNEDQE